MENQRSRDIGLRLSVIARLLRQDFDRLVIKQGITRSQWTMIVVVARKPGSTQREIAEVLDVTEASAGRLIDRLCADGLLVRLEKADDRRARAVHITDKAKPLLECLATVGNESEARIFSDFTPQELTTFNELLDKLYQRLSNP